MELSEFEGKMIVVTAPSGAGKTTIVRHLLSKYKFLDFSVSATTRSKRKEELDGKDYYFLSMETFQKYKRNRKFIEWEEVYEDQYYGTLISELDRLWNDKKHIIFDIDVKGAINIKKKYKEKCLAIFIKPPSLATLIERLTNRNTESESSLKKRIRRVKREMTFENKFDKVLVNDLLEGTLQEAELLIEDFLIT